VPAEFQKQHPPGAIVFDFDGVLVDSEAAHGAALAAAGESMALCQPGPPHDWYIGLGDVECFRRMAEAGGRTLSEADIALLIERKAEAFAAECRAGNVNVFPGAVELVRAAAEEAPIAVCSGSRRRDILPILETLGLVNLLRTVVTAEDVARTKPDPLPYLLTAERLGVPPGGCVAIEDSPAGVAAAVAAGYGRVHAVCHTFSRNRLAAAHHIHQCTRDFAAADLWPIR
jgi:beta-phosphoglucomutase